MQTNDYRKMSRAQVKNTLSQTLSRTNSNQQYNQNYTMNTHKHHTHTNAQHTHSHIYARQTLITRTFELATIRNIYCFEVLLSCCRTGQILMIRRRNNNSKTTLRR